MKVTTTIATVSILMLIFSTLNRAYSTELQAGDIAIIAVSSNSPKSFEFINLTDIDAGTVIYFTDDAWINADNAFRGSEGIVKYTAPTDIALGTITQWNSDNPNFEKTGAFTLSATGDNILCYQDIDNPRFIFGIGWAKNTKGNWEYLSSTSGSTATSDIPDGLSIQNYTVTHLGNMDSYAYSPDALHEGSGNELLFALSKPENYLSDDENTLTCDEQTFTITNKKDPEDTESESETTSTSSANSNEDDIEHLYVCQDVGSEYMELPVPYYTSNSLAIKFDVTTWQGADTLIFSSSESPTLLSVQRSNSVLEINETTNGLITENEEIATWYFNNTLIGESEECATEESGTYYCTQEDKNGCIAKSDNYKVIIQSTSINMHKESTSACIYIDLLGRIYLTNPKTFSLQIQK